jgi:hypothetical protein
MTSKKKKIACRRTLDTMTSKKFACRRTLDTTTSIFFRLPADFRYNDFKKKKSTCRRTLDTCTDKILTQDCQGAWRAGEETHVGLSSLLSLGIGESRRALRSAARRPCGSRGGFAFYKLVTEMPRDSKFHSTLPYRPPSPPWDPKSQVSVCV